MFANYCFFEFEGYIIILLIFLSKFGQLCLDRFEEFVFFILRLATLLDLALLLLDLLSCSQVLCVFLANSVIDHLNLMPWFGFPADLCVKAYILRLNHL